MQPKVFSLIDKAVTEFNLIPNGSKIVVGSSGGKDSTLLLEYLANRKKRFSSDFSFEAVYIQTDFAPPFNAELLKIIENWKIPFCTLNVDALKSSKDGKKMSCYWCSTRRRSALLDFAIKNGFDSIALGHHLDDILETFLMNSLEKGVLSTMKVRFAYEKYPVKIIRPLAYCPVNMIVEHSKNSGWKEITCTCSYQDNSGRKSARKKLDALTFGNEKSKWRLFSALKNASLL